MLKQHHARTAHPVPVVSTRSALVKEPSMRSSVVGLVAVWLTSLSMTYAAETTEPDFATLSPEQVREFELKIMRQIADLALIPPKMNTSPLPEYDYDRLDYGMTIGIERTPRGRLWACWVAGGDSPKAFFVLASSDDNGETWSKPRLVVDSHSKNLPMDRSVLVGNLWTDPLGRLWLIFDQSMHMFDGRAGVWASVCENPDADEPTWSVPRRIWHGVTLNKPTVLSTGEWMLPISLDQREGFGPFKGLFKELDPLRGANVFVSTDQGATWQRRGAVRFPNPDWHEHMIVERKDGSLWMLARTSKGIMQSTSHDAGKTWAEPTEPPGIRQPNARFHVRRLASGKLLLVKHGDRIDQHEGRVQLSAWLSADDGQTWQGGLILDERKGVSYPDGMQAPDGTIYISYDRNRAADGEILLARFTEEDILAKKIVGTTSKLKLLISRPLGLKRDAVKIKGAATGPGLTTFAHLVLAALPQPGKTLPQAVEKDARLQADGKGWRLDQAKIVDTTRPRVLLIGDSILNGYLKSVISQLEGKAYVDAWVNPYNQSEHVNKLLAEVLAHGPYDVVHFNMGLHGWQKGRIKDGTFEPLTRAYVQVIREKLPKAEIIWASSTPVTVKGKPGELFPEINDIIVEHNRLAANVMKDMDVPVNDFYALLASKLELARGDQFHWRPEAYTLLADQVTNSILKALAQ